MTKAERITVDCAKFTDRAAVHNVLRQALRCEEYIGSNLDALHDALTSVGVRTRLTLKSFSSAERSLGEYAAKLALVLAVSASENKNLSVTFE